MSLGCRSESGTTSCCRLPADLPPLPRRRRPRCARGTDIGRAEQPCLADLSRNAIDVTGLQEVCRRKYLAWHEVRIRAVLSALRTLSPPPDVVAFPECSIPISSLHELLSYADESKACVFAGTHSVLAGPKALAQYESLRIAKATMKEIKGGRHAGAAVLPIITSDQTYLHFKALSSAFEHTDITTSSVDFSIVDPVIVEIRGAKIRFRVGICSEAARMQSASADYDVLMICAFNDGIEPFLPVITHNVQNRRPAVFVNDGHSVLHQCMCPSIRG